MGRPVEGTALATVREKLQAIRIKGPPSMTGLGSNAVKPFSYTPSTCDAPDGSFKLPNQRRRGGRLPVPHDREHSTIRGACSSSLTPTAARGTTW